MSTDKSRKEKAKREDDLYRDEPDYPRKRLKFSLPLGISVNHMHMWRRGQRILTPKAREYIKDAKALIQMAIEDQNWMKQSHAVWYYCDIVVHMPDRRIRDSHNLLKLMIDVMQGVIFENDYYCMPRVQSVEYDVENPRVDICITPQTKKDRVRAEKMTT